MGKHDEDATLRELIRAGIRAGTLPDRFPTFTWAGSGHGAQCVICGLTVTGDQIEVEFELDADQGKSEGPFSMHPACYKVWESTLLELRGHPMLGNRESQASIRRRG